MTVDPSSEDNGLLPHVSTPFSCGCGVSLVLTVGCKADAPPEEEASKED
jgi:hypothetical protein